MDLMVAFVQWMKPDYIAVICPLCSKEETHAYQFQDGHVDKIKPTVLDAQCSPSGATYRAIFPWQRGLAMEKNWAGGRLDVVGLELHDLEIEGAWDPTNFEILKPPVGGRVIEKTQRGRCQRANSTFGYGVDISPQLHLGDLTKISTVGVKPNFIEIRAPFATIDGVLLSEPLGIIHADRSLLRKTTGILVREGPFTPIIAASGWKDCFINPKNILRQKLWVTEVLKLCDYVSHELELDPFDKIRPGQVHASHAEKQLIAFAIRMHCFLDDDLEPSYMYKLKKLPLRVPEIWIVVDNDPCEDCDFFRKKVESVCKMKIHFVRMEREIEYGMLLQSQDIQGPRTPDRTKLGAFSLSTPPDSSNRLSEDYLTDSEDGEYGEEVESGDEQPPCRGRNLRFLGTPQRPIRIQTSPPSSPTMRSLRRVEKSKRVEALPAESSQSIAQVSPPAPSAHKWISNADVIAAIADVDDSMAQEGDESEEEMDEVLPRKSIVDLTLDSSTDDDGSEGSVFYPEAE